MCGRFALVGVPKALLAAYGLSAPEMRPRYNIAPTQEIAVVMRESGASAPALACPRWGLVPHWARDAGLAARMINARAETVDAKPAFRDAFRRRRCLIPADAFYEWRREGKARTPFCFAPAAGGEPLVFAGLWDEWRGDGEPLRTCAILTTEANADMRPIHERMPVILRREAWEQWLNPAVRSRHELENWLAPPPGGFLRSWRVADVVNSAANDTLACMDSVEFMR